MSYQSYCCQEAYGNDFLSASTANSQNGGGVVCFNQNTIRNSCNLCMKNDHIFIHEAGYYFITYQLNVKSNCHCDQNLSAYLCLNGCKIDASCTTSDTSTFTNTVIVYIDENSCLSLQTNCDKFKICSASINIFKL